MFQPGCFWSPGSGGLRLESRRWYRCQRWGTQCVMVVLLGWIWMSTGQIFHVLLMCFCLRFHRKTLPLPHVFLGDGFASQTGQSGTPKPCQFDDYNMIYKFIFQACFFGASPFLPVEACWSYQSRNKIPPLIPTIEGQLHPYISSKSVKQSYIINIYVAL